MTRLRVSSGVMVCALLGAPSKAPASAPLTPLRASQPAASAGRRTDVEMGRVLYQDKCQTCHGAEGQGGDARLEKVLGAMPKALRAEEVQNKSDAQILVVIRSGRGKMKPVEGLTAAQRRQVLAYVRTMRQPKP
jgi:mono/diheme cytochrome c family protein